MPAAVGSAYRHGDGTDDDLLSGRAWTDLLSALARAGAVMTSPRAPATAVDQASGYRQLLVLVALAIDEALRPSDPYDPFFSPANVDNVLKWGMDCPDAAYTGAAIRPDATYRIRGRRSSVRYLGFQVMSGIANSGNLVADDLALGPGGTFEIVLSAEPRPGNWMALPEGTSSVVVRQFFYDWDTEEPAELEIECVEAPARPPAGPADALSAAGVARQLRALGEFVEASIAFWLDVEEGGRSQGVNHLPPAGRPHRDGGGGRERERLGFVDPRRRRGPSHRGHAARGALLERLHRQLLVGHHRLRQPPVEPERPPGRPRRRRRLPGRGRRARPRGGQLAGHGRATTRGP